MKKSIISKITMVFVMIILCAMCLVGCSSIAIDIDTNAEVTGNGTLAVQKGNYLYFVNRKKNLNKVLIEEGSKIITERLDILNMFSHLYVIELMQKKFGIEPKGMNMSDNCKNNLQIYNLNNNYKSIEN